MLAGDLLDVGRVQAGQFPVHPHPHDLTRLVEACVQRQRELLPANTRHTITLQQPASAVVVALDPVRLDQVLSNLLDNAVKYSPAGGEVTVTTEVTGSWARVHIADRGIGIPADDLAHVFTPFYRGTNAPSTTFGGLGLGLPLSRAIIEAHGGELTVRSVEGQGTSFTVALPLYHQEA